MNKQTEAMRKIITGIHLQARNSESLIHYRKVSKVSTNLVREDNKVVGVRKTRRVTLTLNFEVEL